MKSENDKKQAKRSIWRHRGRQFATGLNVCISVSLAGLVLLMVNYLAYRYYLRWDLSWRGYYGLSDKTKGLLSSLDTDVDIIAFFQKHHKFFGDVKNLLKEYEYEAAKIKSLNLEIDFVDPDRDLARAKELARKYDVRTPNVIVFESASRRKYVEAKDIVDYERLIDYERLLSGRPAIEEKVAFVGEQVFSSAIQNITQAAKPTVYFLEGHGEHDINDYSSQSGYSSLARIMRRDNMEVKSLLLAEYRCIPEDCSALVIAGPDRKLSRVEVDFLSKYLDRNGRVFLLIDPAVTTGLDSLLEDWGVKLEEDVVVDPHRTLTGRELFVTQYGEHPITRNLNRVTTVFYMPRSIEPVQVQGASPDTPADKPRVFTLASNTSGGWAEKDLHQRPAKFDAGVDRPGPVSVAVAVEKGPVSEIEVEIKPTRMVVVGDSSFVSNGGLRGGVGGSLDFFMSAMNWLLEREALMAIAPKVPGKLRLDMNRDQMRTLFLIIVVAVPAAVAFIGLTVWLKRRY